jgi:hypothetical protein
MERVTAGEKLRTMASRKNGAAYGLGGSIGKVERAKGCSRKVTMIERFDGRAFLVGADGTRTDFPNMDEASKFARKTGVKVEIYRCFGEKQPG